MESPTTLRDFGNLKTDFSPILSDQGRLIAELVNYVILCDIICSFGMTANIINIIMFSKQGFGNTVNIAFVGLAFSDLCCLVSLVWSSICMNPLIVYYGVPWAQIEVMYITAGWAHVSFCRITSYITVYITAERCLCIIFPLKIKQIITQKTTTITVCLIYIVNLLSIIPEAASSTFSWEFYASINRTLLSVVYTKHRQHLEGLSYVMHSTMSTTSFVGAILFTSILIVKLRKSSTWRQSATKIHKQTGSMSAKDRATVKMIVLIAVVLIVCNLPGAAVSMTIFTVGPEFFIGGRYSNLCIATWSIAFVFQGVNSSVNIFVYYKMSSKYRQTFHKTILKHFKDINNYKG